MNVKDTKILFTSHYRRENVHPSLLRLVDIHFNDMFIAIAKGIWTGGVFGLCSQNARCQNKKKIHYQCL